MQRGGDSFEKREVLDVVAVVGFVNNFIKIPSEPVNRLFPATSVLAIVIIAAVWSWAANKTTAIGPICFFFAIIITAVMLLCVIGSTTLVVKDGKATRSLLWQERLLPHSGQVVCSVLSLKVRCLNHRIPWLVPDANNGSEVATGSLWYDFTETAKLPCAVKQFKVAADLLYSDETPIVSGCLKKTTKEPGYTSEFVSISPTGGQTSRMVSDNKSVWRAKHFLPYFRRNLAAAFGKHNAKIDRLRADFCP